MCRITVRGKSQSGRVVVLIDCISCIRPRSASSPQPEEAARRPPGDSRSSNAQAIRSPRTTALDSRYAADSESLEMQPAGPPRRRAATTALSGQGTALNPLAPAEAKCTDRVHDASAAERCTAVARLCLRAETAPSALTSCSPASLPETSGGTAVERTRDRLAPQPSLSCSPAAPTNSPPPTLLPSQPAQLSAVYSHAPDD